ncbi:DUF6680 family protein [Desulfuromonas acetexigens]|uniref:DUF6680 domain-containing protein n=1 Tax=Trichloromonas acetexigens TaxID=38815 RepID=A0A550J8Z1_9BACT|nr:DUF6680 family protein [Desulfuromonas acetexigens]TRO79709.1 hypothetical protein FL622_12420 [Desulfuromonas acetexigens]
MTNEQILLTIVSSLLSGIIGVFISSLFYSRLEKRKMKIETARKMFGARHNIAGTDFKSAMNEIMIVFSDSQKVINAMENMFSVVETPPSARSEKAADEALIKLMKEMCTDIGVNYKNLPESYYLKFFTMP